MEFEILSFLESKRLLVSHSKFSKPLTYYVQGNLGGEVCMYPQGQGVIMQIFYTDINHF